ncbi:MAG: hypothetical protein HGA50_14725 [Deltaproteobacteria bacterium]|nr:hypothetical protein [Deltaproteobacteria bacterium]
MFAESYTKRLLATYLLHKAPQIDRCFDTLESVAAEKGLPSPCQLSRE